MTKKDDETTITSKSTKRDILEAYEQLRGKFEKRETEAPASLKVRDKQKEDEKKILERASSYTGDRVIQNIAHLKLHVGKSLDEISEKLIGEARKLDELKTAINLEKKYIEEVHDIKVSADALSILIQDYEEKKKAFGEEATQKREELKRHIQEVQEKQKNQQAEYETRLKEWDERLKKERTREKEEYEYNLKLTRKKDKDIYEQKKADLERELKEKREKQEKEFAERGAELFARESELKELKKKVESFEPMLEKEIHRARKEAMAIAEEKAKIVAQLYAKDKEGEMNLLKYENKKLQEDVEKFNSQFEGINKQLSGANQQVLTIAAKAIEGASGAKTLKTVQEIAMEQAKRTKVQG
ncbi:MAG: hypothetical protein K8T10_12495 [Candidatus Eremiobacteraeota bacterium]|nr:hypothetical protein [Candidatus Eremiobacteraeota bacterium]